MAAGDATKGKKKKKKGGGKAKVVACRPLASTIPRLLLVIRDPWILCSRTETESG